MGGWQTSRTWVVSGCDGRGTDGWDVSQQFLRRSKDRRLGLEPNSFSNGWQTDAEDSSRLGLDLNSFSVGQRTDAWYSSIIVLKPNSFAVGRHTDVWDSSQLTQFDWYSSQSIVSGIFCAKKFCVSQFWEHGNWHFYPGSHPFGILRHLRNWHGRYLDWPIWDQYNHRMLSLLTSANHKRICLIDQSRGDHNQIQHQSLRPFLTQG